MQGNENIRFAPVRNLAARLQAQKRIIFPCQNDAGILFFQVCGDGKDCLQIVILFRPVLMSRTVILPAVTCVQTDQRPALRRLLRVIDNAADHGFHLFLLAGALQKPSQSAERQYYRQQLDGAVGNTDQIPDSFFPASFSIQIHSVLPLHSMFFIILACPHGKLYQILS